MYTDNSILTWGKHKFTKLCRIPADYLLRLTDCNCPDNELLKYIEFNKDAIIARNEGIVDTPEVELGFKFVGNRVKIICPDTEKIIFISEKDAKNEIQRIMNLTQTQKKPVRAYECTKCGGWHLTSISYEEYEK